VHIPVVLAVVGSSRSSRSSWTKIPASSGQAPKRVSFTVNIVGKSAISRRSKYATPSAGASLVIANMDDVQYFIRVTVVDPGTKKVLFRHDEDIEMFTHENTDTGFELWDDPASGLLLGTSLHAGTRAFR